MAFSQENDGGSLRYKKLYLALAFITRSPSVAYGASSLPEGAYVGVHSLTEILIILIYYLGGSKPPPYGNNEFNANKNSIIPWQMTTAKLVVIHGCGSYKSECRNLASVLVNLGSFHEVKIFIRNARSAFLPAPTRKMPYFTYGTGMPVP